MERVFIISDTHFYHTNIIKYCGRPFKTTSEMNEVMIERWNETVRPQDTVFHLGDFALSGKDNIASVVKKLNGRKILIEGNHEGYSPSFYREAGFWEVSRWPILYKDFCILSHKPIALPQTALYKSVYGHVHSDVNYKDVTPYSFCACVERINYTPINIDEIAERIADEEAKEDGWEV